VSHAGIYFTSAEKAPCRVLFSDFEGHQIREVGTLPGSVSLGAPNLDVSSDGRYL
jgi:hypothetical protein